MRKSTQVLSPVPAMQCGAEFNYWREQESRLFSSPWLAATGIKSAHGCHGGFTHVRGMEIGIWEQI